MAKLFYPLEVMRLRNDAGLRSVVAASMFSADAHLRFDAKKQQWRGHQGWDLMAHEGTPAFAIADGLVVWKLDAGAYGKQLLLQFGEENKSSSRTCYAFYAHLSEIQVASGAFVRGGQTIAKTGVTGNASPQYPHLHFEIRTTSAHLGQGLTGRRDPSSVFGGQLLSCTSDRIGGVDTVRMVCISTGQATPVAP